MCVCVCHTVYMFTCVCEKGCYNEDYFPSHEKRLYQATTHSPCRIQALVAPVDLAQEIIGVTRLGPGHRERGWKAAKHCNCEVEGQRKTELQSMAKQRGRRH